MSCKLNFYQRDARGLSKSLELSVDDTTYDQVAKHLELDQDWDKKLLKALFYSKFDWVVFTKVKSPAITHVVQIVGSRKESCEDVYEPVESEDKMAVSFETLQGQDKYELNYEKIVKGWTKDPAIIAFFNNKTFKKIEQISLNLGIARKMELL
jgi:hypothetical protein